MLFIIFIILIIAWFLYGNTKFWENNLTIPVRFFKKNRIFFFGVLALIPAIYILLLFSDLILISIQEIWNNKILFIFFLYFFTIQVINTFAEYIKNKNNKRYQLVTFSDAIVKELMDIKQRIVSLQISQDRLLFKKNKKDQIPVDLNFPDNFLKLFRMYQSYPKEAFCYAYQKKNKKWAGMIMWIDASLGSDFEHIETFDVINFRSIHSYKNINSIKSGDMINAYFYDPDTNDKLSTSCKILSIKYAANGDDKIIKIECTEEEFISLEWSSEELIPEVIIKEVIIDYYNPHEWLFVVDK